MISDKLSLNQWFSTFFIPWPTFQLKVTFNDSLRSTKFNSRRKNLVISKKKVFILNLSAISQFSSPKHKKRSSVGTCFQFFDHNDFIIHITFILIYAQWPTENTTVAHHWAMAHRLKTPGLNRESMQTTLLHDLEMQKMCAKMVPKILSEDQKQN